MGKSTKSWRFVAGKIIDTSGIFQLAMELIPEASRAIA
jgi:hypothetical protein